MVAGAHDSAGLASNAIDYISRCDACFALQNGRGKMSLQAALSKLRGNPSAVSSDKRRTVSTVSSFNPTVLPPRPPLSSGGAAFTQGAFDVPFDDVEEDDDEVNRMTRVQASCVVCTLPVARLVRRERSTCYICPFTALHRFLH